MKIFAGLALAGVMVVGQASAATFVAGNCYQTGNVFGFNNGAPQSSLSGSLVCPSAASLGITGSLVVASEFINYYSDYSNGEATTVSISTQWSFSGAGLQLLTDTTTVTGGSNSTPATSASNGGGVQVINPAIPVDNKQNVSDPGILLQGFYDNVTGAFGAVTVNFTNFANSGSAVQATGYAQVVYDYNNTSATPEPVSMVLFGAGLLGVSLIGRKKFARK